MPRSAAAHPARPSDLDATNSDTAHPKLEVAETSSPERTVHPRNKLNDLTSTEWIAETKSFWFQKGLGSDHPHAEIERLHPAPFSYQDVARIVSFFTKAGERVLDPFMGVGSTLKACALLGRRAVGIELMSTWAQLAQLRLQRELDGSEVDTAETLIINDDARNALRELDDNAFRLIVTSPPYWKILTKLPDHKTIERANLGLELAYGDDPRDLGAVETYEEFLAELMAIFCACERVTMPGGHLVVIVGDFRHGRTFIPFHADLARGLPTRSGWVLQAVNVVLQNHKRLYPYGYPYAYVPNIHHQFVLIFKRSG